jgi:hypothetical protein
MHPPRINALIKPLHIFARYSFPEIRLNRIDTGIE